MTTQENKNSNKTTTKSDDATLNVNNFDPYIPLLTRHLKVFFFCIIVSSSLFIL